MTASEQLTALHANRLGFTDKAVVVMDALPALAAVVAAAEKELPSCGEWLYHPERGPHRCGEPADFILWGKMLDPEALGPRCYGHAIKWQPMLSIGDLTGWAIVDLRPRRRALAELNRVLGDKP